jgi:hypothetical protein
MLCGSVPSARNKGPTAIPLRQQQAALPVYGSRNELSRLISFYLRCSRKTMICITHRCICGRILWREWAVARVSSATLAAAATLGLSSPIPNKSEYDLGRRNGNDVLEDLDWDVKSRVPYLSAARGDRLLLAWMIRAALVVFVAVTLFKSDGHSQVHGVGTERQATTGIYIPPNEQHPAVALSIYRESNHGVYVSVGTERSFIGAALTGAEALYVIDYDPLAVRFAKVNRALLAASTNRADYARLRLSASQDVWRERSQQLSGEDKETLADPDSWAFWDKRVRKSWSDRFGEFHKQPKHADDPFFGSNYLFDDLLYRHLRRLAKSERIWARVVDLRHEDEVGALCDDLKSKGLRLGVIDTSDVPSADFEGASLAARSITLFSGYAQDDTLFLSTAAAHPPGIHWSYYAFTGGKVRGRDDNTLQRWYEIEMTKISASQQVLALVDDPDAINH